MRDAMRCTARVAVIALFAALLGGPRSAWAEPILGSAVNFAVLGGSAVTNTGSTTLNGDLGVYPGSSITGLVDITFKGGSNQSNDAVSQQAQADETNAYDVLKGEPFTMNLTSHDLGTSGTSPIGLLDPGVYFFSSTAQLNGTLTLDAQGNPDAQFIFQIGSSLTTASASSVDVINGGAGVGVFWLLGVGGSGSATLGTTTAFEGNILSLDSVTLTTGATILCGRAFAQTGSVTMDTNTVSDNCATFNGSSGSGGGNDFGSGGFSGGPTPVPEPRTIPLLRIGFISLVAASFRRSSRKAL